ncbi:MAG TPA: hypothetical protein VF155_07900 [Candidatus Dormibacteraeota bacterium]
MQSLDEQLTRCWAYYRLGLLGDVSRALRLAHALYREELPSLGAMAAANATVELAMLDVIVGLVTAETAEDLLRGGGALAEMVGDPTAACDDVHRLAGMATAVHAGMRAGRFRAAQRHFRSTLAMAQGLIADEAGSDEVCVLLGCAGLHMAQAAAICRDETTTHALLDHSDEAAATLGAEHELLGQYFGPEHARATRSICYCVLGRLDESMAVGREVNTDRLMPLMAATLLRTMADTAERNEGGGSATVLRARADSLVPPLRQQFA